MLATAIKNDIRVGVGLGTGKDMLPAAQEALRQARLNLQTTKVDLAIVFSSIDFNHYLVAREISDTLGGNVPLVGCSSAALITREGIHKHGVAIALISIPSSIYLNTACVSGINAKSPAAAGKELGDKLLYGFRDILRNFGMIFSDGLISDSSSLVRGLQDRLGTSFPLAGASASDNFTRKETYVYCNEGAFNDAACGVLWGGRLRFGLGTQHGWKPLGKPHYVTKASGNIAYEIDGRPAAALYEEYFSYDLDRLRKELKFISLFYPIGVYLEGEEEYLLRNILSIRNDGSLAFQGDIPEDAQIRLMIGTKESCLRATEEAISEVKMGLGGHAMKILFVFNSSSRYSLLGRQARKELEIIQERIDKNTSLVGFYTYGEEAPLKALNYQGKTHFHNQTITLLGIGG